MCASYNFHNSFLGTPLVISPTLRNNHTSHIQLGRRRKLTRKIYACDDSKPKNQWVTKISNFCGKHVEMFKGSVRSRTGSKLGCVNESTKSVFGNLLSPLRRERLILFRGSVFVAVLSGVCLLLWYGQNKTKGYVEAKLLPSVCSMVSECIQREVDFGKVKRISPLSITLESISIGPHNEEFSCGEVSTMKLRIRPFSSLRRGKIVVDAVLSHPTLLVSQKRDYSWLGIPSTDVVGLKRHLSSEEGIDYRTKNVRIAREEAAARRTRERDSGARVSAELGYIVSERCSENSGDDVLMQHTTNTTKFNASVDQKVQWEDHQCMDTGVEYDMKHADLEKSFGVRVPGSGLKLWSKVVEGPKKRKLVRKANGSDIMASSISVKRKILNRSALAAVAYFRSLSNGKPGEPSELSESNNDMEQDSLLKEGGNLSAASTDGERLVGCEQNREHINPGFLGPFELSGDRLDEVSKRIENLRSTKNVVGALEHARNIEDIKIHAVSKNVDVDNSRNEKRMFPKSIFRDCKPWLPGLSLSYRVFPPTFPESLVELFIRSVKKLKSEMGPEVDNFVAELVDGVDVVQTEGLEKKLPVIVDSIYFKDGTLMLLAYGDREPRELENVDGYVKLQNHYQRVHVQMRGNCKTWRSELVSEDGGWLSTDVFVDTSKRIWHANLKIVNLFVPLFERILEIPITWSKGRASGKVHICMSQDETFPSLYGQIDGTGLEFQIYEAPSSFHDTKASLCFRGQRIFLHNASGFFGSVPLEASGDLGIHPEEGEFHLMCQVLHVEINSLMRTFKMKPLLFPLAGSVTAVFNCQGPLDAPIFVGSVMVSRKRTREASEFPDSAASEALLKSKEAGAVAALDRVPLSYVSANFTFNTDNCIADLYGIRANLVDGGEIRGAGSAWMCPQGESDNTAVDINFSGNLLLGKIMERYMVGYLPIMPLNSGALSGEAKLSGSLSRPRFDIKWAAPKAEGSFIDARGDVIISYDQITINSSSVAYELYTKIKTRHLDEYWQKRKNTKIEMPFSVEGVELDLRMRSFELFSLLPSYSFPFDLPRPVHMKASGRIKFLGKVMKPNNTTDEPILGAEKISEHLRGSAKGELHNLCGEFSISGLKLNQLMLAPQLAGLMNISHEGIKLFAKGRRDESLSVEVVGPLQPVHGDSSEGRSLSVSLQKGQLRANIYYQPLHSANLEVCHLPLDELELASLRGTIQRAEVQLNLQKRRGHGMLSVLRPKFSGVQGEALDIAARWSGDVFTIDKTVLEQAHSHYELQGEYVFPATIDQSLAGKKEGLLERAIAGNIFTVISSMGRWRIRLEVPEAEVAEMLPLARLLSRSTDPAVRSKSKDFFVENLQSLGIYAESLQELLEVIHGHYSSLDEVVLEDVNLPGLADLQGRWHGSLDASGGGNGDTVAEFNFRGEDWEWGTHKTQHVVAVGAYSNDNGLRIERIFIQKDAATVHADGSLLGPKTNLHFAVLNFPVNLVPTLIQVIETSATYAVHSLRQLLVPIEGIVHMEGDLRGSLAKPECDVQVRLLDGTIGGVALGRAEVAASLTSTSRLLFNGKFEPIIQHGHVNIQGSLPVNFIQNNILEEEERDVDKSEATLSSDWMEEKGEEPGDGIHEEKIGRDRNEDGWNMQLVEGLKGSNWNILDVGEVRVDADIKDGGMMLLTALSPYADWLHGNANIMLQVRGTVEQPILDGHAYFHRSSISSPLLRKPLTNFGGTVNVISNRLCISSLESRVSRRGKLSVKGNLPLRTSEASPEDKLVLKCDDLEVRAKNVLSGQVDTYLQISGSILQPEISGNIKLSHGEAYLPSNKGSSVAPFYKLGSTESQLNTGVPNQEGASRYVSRFFGSESAASRTIFSESTVEPAKEERGIEHINTNPKVDIRLSDLSLVLGPELRVVYPLILNFAVAGELELNGQAHPKLIKPKGTLRFENGDVNLVATQVRLKCDNLNTAKFEPEYGLDPMLELALVGSEWQFKIQSRASNWQDNLVVTSCSTRSIEQDALSPTEAARVLESQLAESILESNGQLAFKKLATATLERLMPRIEGKGEIGPARWRIVYAPQIPSLLAVDPTLDILKSLARIISFGTEIEVHLGKRLQASVVRQMKDSEMAMQWTLIYKLTSRLRLLLQSAPLKRLLFEYSTSSQN